MDYYNTAPVRVQSRRDSVSMSMDGMEEEGDDSKRKARNNSEKKRRDEFNRLVVELGTIIVSPNSKRKMDKTTVLKTSIGFLKQHNIMSNRSQAEEIQTDWKPKFLSNEEFSHLMLEALDGFIIVLGTDGHILYTSESMASLLGYMPTSLQNTTLYEIVADNDKIPLYNTLNMSSSLDTNGDQQLKILIHIRRKNLLGNQEEENVTELVELSGYFRKWVNPVVEPAEDLSDDDDKISIKSGVSLRTTPVQNNFKLPQSDKTVFVATGRLATPQLLRVLPVVHQSHSEFTSKHSLEWKFLFVDHRAPPIIGYLTFELLGTSGYDYYHVDDLDQIATCHEAVKQTGEGTSCYYRFLTKGQQWIWLQTRFYITYHMWNSKPEFINATHKVVNYQEVLNQSRAKAEGDDGEKTHHSVPSFRSGSPTWSKSSMSSSLYGSDRTGVASSSRISQETCSLDNIQQGPGPRNGVYSQSRLSIGHTGSLVAARTKMDHLSCGDEAMARTDDDSVSVSSPAAPPLSSPAAPPLSSPAAPPLSSPAAPPLTSPVAPPPSLPPNSPGWSLTPAQQALQLQLKTKHTELSRRIALQQAELGHLGDQLLLTHTGPVSHQGLTVQQQQQSRQLQQQLVQATPQPLQQSQSLQQSQPLQQSQSLPTHVSPHMIHQSHPNNQEMNHNQHQMQQQQQQRHQEQRPRSTSFNMDNS